MDKNPSLEDANVDSDKDGIPDAEELGISCKKRIYNPYEKKYQNMNVWTFNSNPAKKDTDGDGLLDHGDLSPRKYDVVITKETKDKIVFNTGRTWYTISCTAYDFWDNAFSFIDNSVKKPIPSKKFKQLAECNTKNGKQKFNTTELTAIALFNPEGSKLYMDNSFGKVRERVFHNITGRASDKYQHKGILSWEKWKKVSKKQKGGFFKGTVLSEADINFSGKLYRVCDAYTVLNSLVKTGAVILTVVLVAEATPVVLANLKGIEYYCATYGVKEGLDMYCCMGMKGMPEKVAMSVYRVLQEDMQDGDSDICNGVKYASNVVYSKENVWEKTSFARGNEIDKLLGNNLGHNFPVIDRIENRTIISFKSIDLTAKSYQRRNRLYGQLAKYVRQLDRFSGKTWSEKEIFSMDYDVKILQIAIPKASITGEQKLALDAVKLYAKEKGIKLIFTVVTKK